eukprot:gene21718-biopygen7540
MNSRGGCLLTLCDSCHEEGVCDRNRAGIEAADSAISSPFNNADSAISLNADSDTISPFAPLELPRSCCSFIWKC